MGLQYPKSNCGTVDSKRGHAVDGVEDLPKQLFSEPSWHWKLCHVLNVYFLSIGWTLTFSVVSGDY